MKRYIYRGREVYVRAYEAVNLTKYAPFFVDRTGHERLFLFNSELTVRDTMEEAQRDLDAFAQKRDLPVSRRRKPVAGV
ncbi:MAG: hypothetical protein IKT09_05085 [Synergistes sp.]|nr:hypothetical protein [Synergistes sp.]